MVNVTREICGMTPPQMRTVEKHECDFCGRSCIQSGTRSERLYEYNDEQLCFECLWDALITDGTVTVVG